MSKICVSDKTKYGNRVSDVSTQEEFFDKTGFYPSMRKGEKCCCSVQDCLCMIDPITTANAKNVKLDIGDKYDSHKYWFVLDQQFIELNKMDLDKVTQGWKYKYQQNDDLSNSKNPNNSAYNS